MIENPCFNLAPFLLERNIKHGIGDFKANFEERHPFNIPGPIYVGDDDACGCGPVAAPENVYMSRFPDDNSGEFVFRQPNNTRELNCILDGASHNPVCCYGLDGNKHWNRKLIQKWWAQMKKAGGPIVGVSSVIGDSGFAAWTHYLANGTELYLRQYISFLETGSIPDDTHLLPTLD
jgi:hypothetical protein